MRELQNFSIGLVVLIMAVVFLSTTGCSNISAETSVMEPMPVVPENVCWHIERYTFDTPGIEPHVVKTPKKCEGLLS